MISSGGSSRGGGGGNVGPGGSGSRGGSGAGGSGTGGNAGEGGGGGTGAVAGSGQPGGRSGGGTSGTAGQAGESGAAGDPGGGKSGGTGSVVPDSNKLVYWFSADFGVTAEDEFITEWRDQSGRAAHAMQTVAALRPKLGTFAGSDLPAIVFDGEDDYLDLLPLDTNFEAGVTFFCVALAAQDSLGSAMVELSNGKEIDDLTFLRFQGGFTYEVVGAVAETATGTFALGEPHLVDVVHSADTTIWMFINGIGMNIETPWGPLATPADLTRSQNSIGRTLYEGARTWPGQIAEILLYSRALPPIEREAVQAYLSSKWNCCTE